MIGWIGLALLCAVASTAEGCGRRPFSARVVNGQDASPHAWPWQISLRVRGGHICGGSLIRDNIVITAAHCVYRNKSPSGYTVVVGAHKRTGSTSVQQTFRLKNLHIHAGFTMQNLRDDIAVLELDGRVKLSDKVNTVCLPNGDVAVGAKCYITGWGRTGGGQPAADILQQAVLPAVSDAECRKKYGGMIDRKAHLCAGEGRSAASGGCNGDSGGPLVCEENGKFVLHGAVSFGRRNCPTTHFTVFARINSYLDWISNKIGGGPPPPGTPAPPTGGPPPPPPTQGPPPPPTQPPACSDLSSRCPHYKKYCQKSSYIRKRCPKTCNTCGSATQPPPACIDSRSWCPSYKKRCGWSWVQKYCPKTCNKC